jgi:ABC-type transport system involved in cytochrome c biogenesis ATPase subunit/GNAT superfamily N-acetyltransferase
LGAALSSLQVKIVGQIRRTKPKLYRVDASDSQGFTRRLKLNDGKSGAIPYKTHRFALVGKGDDVELDSDLAGKAFISSKESNADRIQFSPAFEAVATLKLGSDDLRLKIREVVSENDLAAYEYLEKFHYKTSALDDDSPKVETGGRRAVLIAYANIEGSWQAAGYLELQMPLLMVKPRHELFNLGFKHPTRPIQWVKWDQHAIKNYVNLIVRVARIVTAPDLRGIGLARVLINAAKRFSKERWHIGGRRPIFMEISAEMLNYVDFVSSAGFRLVGSTEGNSERVLKDLYYMNRGYGVSSGIMSLQKSYVTKLKKLCSRSGRNFDEVLVLLRSVIEGKIDTNSLTASEWYLLRSVIRGKIPYYLCALDEPTEQFIQQALGAVRRPKLVLHDSEDPGPLDVVQLQVRSSYELPPTELVRTILQAFGLAGDTIKQTILEPYDLTANPGNIIFVAGASGSGKSMLLRSLDDKSSLSHVRIEYEKRTIPLGGAAWLEPILSTAPLIEYFAEKWGPERSMAALNLAGLSEAFIYLKPFSLLSRGQKYRAMLAALCLSPSGLWLIDEFGADLDPLSARIVAHNLRRLVVRLKKVAIVAAANHGHYLGALHPTRVITLRQGAPAQIIPYQVYRDELQARRR